MMHDDDGVGSGDGAKLHTYLFYYTVSGPPCAVYTYWHILTENLRDDKSSYANEF